MNRKCAFTLAEVLITLGIIGVVAAMTLPALVESYQKQVLLTQLKKTYVTLNNGVTSLRAKYDNVDPVQMPFVHSVWNHSAYLDSTLFGPEFAEHLPTDWHRSDGNSQFCFNTPEDYNYKYMNGSNTQAKYIMTQTNNNYTFQLKDGACVEFAYGTNWEWDDNANRRFIVDVNGSYKNPNTIGKDIFYFVFKPDGRILPYGLDLTPTEQYNQCRGNGHTCASLIFKAGWSLPKNYPW